MKAIIGWFKNLFSNKWFLRVCGVLALIGIICATVVITKRQCRQSPIKDSVTVVVSTNTTNIAVVTPTNNTANPHVITAGVQQKLTNIVNNATNAQAELTLLAEDLVNLQWRYNQLLSNQVGVASNATPRATASSGSPSGGGNSVKSRVGNVTGTGNTVNVVGGNIYHGAREVFRPWRREFVSTNVVVVHVPSVTIPFTNTQVMYIDPNRPVVFHVHSEQFSVHPDARDFRLLRLYYGNRDACSVWDPNYLDPHTRYNADGSYDIGVAVKEGVHSSVPLRFQVTMK